MNLKQLSNINHNHHSPCFLTIMTSTNSSLVNPIENVILFKTTTSNGTSDHLMFVDNNRIKGEYCDDNLSVIKDDKRRVRKSYNQNADRSQF